MLQNCRTVGLAVDDRSTGRRHSLQASGVPAEVSDETVAELSHRNLELCRVLPRRVETVCNEVADTSARINPALLAQSLKPQAGKRQSLQTLTLKATTTCPAHYINAYPQRPARRQFLRLVHHLTPRRNSSPSASTEPQSTSRALQKILVRKLRHNTCHPTLCYQGVSLGPRGGSRARLEKCVSNCRRKC